MRIGAIIQARMGSTRLPGKVMLEISGKTVLGHVIERVKQSKKTDVIIIATTADPRDNLIEEEALKYGVAVFRGSEQNVLERYYLAAKENELDVVVRITSDCPLIDPHIVDKMIDHFKHEKYDISTNAGIDSRKRTFPRGLDIEIFTFSILQKAYQNAKENYQLEHVTPYIYETAEACYFFKNDIDLSNYRWTLDTKEDLFLIKKIYENLYRGKHDFYLSEILHLMQTHPELQKINKNIKQKEIEIGDH